MKKIMLSMVALLFAGAMFAQTPEEKAAAKAAKAAEKEAKKAAMDKYNQGLKCYTESNLALGEFNTYKQTEKNADKLAAKQAEITDKMVALAKQGDPLLKEAFETGLIDEKKYFEGWRARDFMLSQLINVELQKAQAKEPFDTAYFKKATLDMCEACHYQLKYGKASDPQQEAIIKGVKMKFPNLNAYLAYATQFDIENKDIAAACESFENYKNFGVKYPEVANEPKVQNPPFPYAQFAFNIYYIAYQAKKYDICEKYYQEALTFEDQGSHDYVVQSHAQMSKATGNDAQWVEEMKKMIDADPKSESAAVATQNLLSYYNSKGSDEMIKFADEILAKYPDNTVANYGMGFALYAKQKYADALKYYEKAAEVDPTYVDAIQMCGVCNFNIATANNRKINDKIKSYKTQAAADADIDKNVKSYMRKAIPFFEKVRELEPNKPERWAGELKTIYTTLGDKAKAAALPKL